MKRQFRFGTVAAGITGLALVASAWTWTPVSAASAPANLAVSAAVAKNCTITTTPLAFGAYDPIVTNATAPLDGTGGVVVTCPKGSTATIGLGLGANASGAIRRMVLGTDFLTYELYKDVAGGSIWGDAGAALLTPPDAPSKEARTFTVYGRVAPGQDVAAGTFTDTVVATVNF